MRAISLAVAMTVCFAIAPLALAEDCTPTTSTSGTRGGVLVGPDPVFSFYFVNDNCQPECLFSMWFYQETNTIPGLQRNDEVVDNTCGGQIDADTILS